MLRGQLPRLIIKWLTISLVSQLTKTALEQKWIKVNLTLTKIHWSVSQVVDKCKYGKMFIPMKSTTFKTQHTTPIADHSFVNKYIIIIISSSSSTSSIIIMSSLQKQVTTMPHKTLPWWKGIRDSCNET